jgi:hypothetical protein
MTGPQPSCTLVQACFVCLLYVHVSVCVCVYACVCVPPPIGTCCCVWLQASSGIPTAAQKVPVKGTMFNAKSLVQLLRPLLQ